MPYIYYNSKIIEYNLSRNSRKNVNLSIKNDGNLYVSAPKRVSINEIEKILFSKIEWILKSQKNINSKKIIKNVYSFNNNSFVYIYGDLKKITTISSETNSLIITDNEVLFFVKEKYKDDLNYMNTTFNKLLKAELEKTSLKFMDKYLKLLSLNISTFKIRSMKNRWGTCIPSKKEIILNFNLIHCPKDSIEYVVLHEIMHLVHPNHSSRFYASIEIYMYDWKNRKSMLQEYLIK